jgi:Ferritin-like domain
MRRMHEELLDVVARERDRLLDRRRLLTGGVRLTAGGALALTAVGTPAVGRLAALAAAQDFKDDLEVLNYALTLEHLEYAFYRDGVGKFDLGEDPFGNAITTYAMAIRDHEGVHVKTLTGAVTNLGGTPVEEATYDFGYDSDPKKFLATAQALENTGVMAYDGAIQYLTSADLVTAAAAIAAVEARHASYLNLVNGQMPFPAGFEQAKSKAEILEVAGPFIKS